MSGNLRSIDAVFVLVQSQSRGFLDPWQSHLLAQGLPDLLGIWQRAMLPSVHRTFWHWMPGPPALITTFNQLLARSSRCANSWLHGLGALSPRLSFFFTSTARRWPSDLESDQVHPIKSTGRSRTREKKLCLLALGQLRSQEACLPVLASMASISARRGSGRPQGPPVCVCDQCVPCSCTVSVLNMQRPHARNAMLVERAELLPARRME